VPNTGLAVLVVVLLGGTLFGLWRRRTDGRVRTVSASPSGSDLVELAGTLGERATLVQFSSAFCQPCRVARTVLRDVAETVPGVRHVEIDAEGHLDVVRRLGITRTPTVFVLDASGQVVRRAVGAPRKADVLAAVGEAVR